MRFTPSSRTSGSVRRAAVSLQNLDAYFAAGAALVGVGNNIVDQRALAAGDRAQVIAHARRFLEPGAGVIAA